MANYDNLIASIKDAIKNNNKQAITGQVLQDAMLEMVSQLGKNYAFGGVATPSTNVGTPTTNTFYIATEAGTYTNMGGVVLNASGLYAIIWDGNQWLSTRIADNVTLSDVDGAIGRLTYEKHIIGGNSAFVDISNYINKRIYVKVVGNFLQWGYFKANGTYVVLSTRQDWVPFIVPEDATRLFVYSGSDSDVIIHMSVGMSSDISTNAADIFELASNGATRQNGYYDYRGVFVENNSIKAVRIKVPEDASAIRFKNLVKADDGSLYVAFQNGRIVLDTIRQVDITSTNGFAELSIPQYTKVVCLAYREELGNFVCNIISGSKSKSTIAELDVVVNGAAEENVSFDKIGYLKSAVNDDSINPDASASNTGFVEIAGRDTLSYKGSISSGGFRVAFYDKDFSLLRDISLVGNGANEISVDLTQPQYKDATYCIASHYGTGEKYLKLSRTQGLRSFGAVSFDRLTQIPNTPLERINQSAGFSRIFQNWGFIGDSLLSGNHNYFNANGQSTNGDDYRYSWGNTILKILNCEGAIYANGGQTARGWITTNNNKGWDKAQSEKREVYVIALGCNDAGNNVNVGTPSDIADDYAKNADSFYGNYAGIIQRLKSIQEKAVFFLVTLPKGDRTNAEQYNSAIRYMATIFSNVHIIDLWEYATPVNQQWAQVYRLQYHLNAMGYLYTAYEILTYIDWIIRKNPKAFRDVAFIGTDKYATADPNVYGNQCI